MAGHRFFRKAEIPLEVVILMIAALTMTTAGTLLFPVASGKLPYYENGLYGLLLFIFGLQTVALGKTPFGDMCRSLPLIAIGLAVAASGIITCFIPDLLIWIPRAMLFLCFGPGGLVLLLRFLFSRDKFRAWMQNGGIFRHLAAGCGAVYLFSILAGLLLWEKDMLTLPETASAILAYGIALMYLSAVLAGIYRACAEAEKGECSSGTGLPVDRAMILLTGVFMVLLGVLLVPVTLGMLPFSGSAQLGLLMVILAIQMLASGNTPIGAFPRSYAVVFCGLLFAFLGIVSCIVPGILVAQLTILIGILNIVGGGIKMWGMAVPLLKKGNTPSEPIPPVLVKLNSAQFTLNLLSIMFGTSMLVPGIIPGQAIGVILALNGCVLLYLLRLLSIIDRMSRAA